MNVCGRYHVGPLRVRDELGNGAGRLRLVICMTCQRALSDREAMNYVHMDETYQKMKAGIKGLDTRAYEGG